jgi:hypothetical protein
VSNRGRPRGRSRAGTARNLVSRRELTNATVSLDRLRSPAG